MSTGTNEMKNRDSIVMLFNFVRSVNQLLVDSTPPILGGFMNPMSWTHAGKKN